MKRLKVYGNTVEEVDIPADEEAAILAEEAARQAEEIVTRKTAAAKNALNKLRDDTYPDVLVFLATLPGAPKEIKDAAIVAVSERANVK